jgi:site-specific recombinase XerD
MVKKHLSSLGKLLESFFDQRLTRQLHVSPATRAAYKDALRLLLSFAAARLEKDLDRLEVQDLRYELILDFLDFLERERGNSIRTRNARLAAIHSFFRHIAYSDPQVVGLAQRILGIGPKRTVKRVVAYLHPPQVDALLATPDRRTQRGRRNYALLLLLLRTGARASEAIGIDIADLSLVPPYQVLIRGKGSKERILPLSNDLVTVMRQLIEEPRASAPRTGALFVDARGHRLSRFGITHIVRRTVKTVSKNGDTLGARSISPHIFRHTAAMRMLQAGVDLAVIRGWLGHTDIQTTHGYLEADVEMKRQALAVAQITPVTPSRYVPTSAILSLLER